MKVFGVTTATVIGSVAGTFPLNRSRESDIKKEERTTDSDTARSGQVCDQNAGCLSLRHFYSSTGFLKVTKADADKIV